MYLETFATADLSQEDTKVGVSKALLDVLHDDEDRFARRMAIDALSKLGRESKGVLAVLEHALSDSKLPVRHGAVQAIAEIGPAALDIVEALSKVMQDESADVRQAATVAVRRVLSTEVPIQK